MERYSGFAWLYGLLGASVVYIDLRIAEGHADLAAIGRFDRLCPARRGRGASRGAAVFVLLGMRKVSAFWMLVMIISIALISPSRGAMLSCVIPIGVAAVLGGQVKRFGPILFAGVLLFFLAYMLSIDVPLPGGRSIGPEQIIDNLESIFGSSDAANLDGTKEWRLRWWHAIVDYTFNGPYFWTGKGFGMGLAEADGFVVGLETGGPMVRSPHNVHLTMLARTGVPGFFLVVCHADRLVRHAGSWPPFARMRGDERWANIFVWLICYGLAILIDASFDVALEGPMIGIWFWSMFGFGIAASMIYAYERERTDQIRLSEAAEAVEY